MVKILNREIRWEKSAITIEADRKHVKAILEDLGLRDAKVVATPGVKDRHEKVEQELEKHKEEKEDWTLKKESGQRSKIEERREDLRARIELAREEAGGTARGERTFNLEVDGRPSEETNHKIRKEESRECTMEEHKAYRSAVMKMNYLPSPNRFLLEYLPLSARTTFSPSSSAFP